MRQLFGLSSAAFVCLLVSRLMAPWDAVGAPVFNVKDYGATGKKADDARPAMQKAMDACTAAGGGIVRLPPGEYTSGTLHLRSHVRIEIEAGATVFASPDPASYDCGEITSKAALFFGEDLEGISIGGGGTVDGQAEYEWRLDDFERAFGHKALMQKLGKPLLRSFPKGFPKRQVFPHLVWLGRCKDVHISGLNFLHSPSWTMALYACQQVACEDLYIYTSLKEGVWADGIDMDGCKNIVIKNCRIETGDDCIVFISENSWGPPLPCENVTVSNCRLSSASAGIKFSEGNRLVIRDIKIKDTILTNVNRGVVFYTTFGGGISNVELTNLTIDCNRFDWFWAGDAQPFYFKVTRLSELTHEPPAPDEAAPGAVRNISIRNVTARAKGSCPVYGHPKNWLENISFENVKLYVSCDPSAPFDQAEHALDFRWARQLTLKNIEVFWEKPALKTWKSALYLQEASRLEVDRFLGGAASPDGELPAVSFDNVADAVIRNSRALKGTPVFLKVSGRNSREIRLEQNDVTQAKIPYQTENDVNPRAVVLQEAVQSK